MTSAVLLLNTRLTEAREAYYAGSPTMTDAEYDALELELAGLVKASPDLGRDADVLTTVGTDSGGRIPHAQPMRSIANVYTVDEAVKWMEDLGSPETTLSAKYDGVSASLTYENGELVKAVTRGDGEAGESILDAVLASSHIPSRLPVPMPRYEIRGELMILRSTMLELNREIEVQGGKPFVSTRNLIAGTLKLKDLSEVRRRQMRFFPWEVLADFLDQSGIDSARDRLFESVELGFAEPTIYPNDSPAELREHLTNFVELILNEKDPEIGMDGVVIKVDSCALRRKLGVGTKFANFQIAYKAQNAKDETVLRDVLWQVSRNGRLTPVGIVDPVVLAGATVERVSLNNLSWIRAMGLKIGSRVSLVRSGDVIPKITGVLDV